MYASQELNKSPLIGQSDKGQLVLVVEYTAYTSAMLALEWCYLLFFLPYFVLVSLSSCLLLAGSVLYPLTGLR